MKATAAYVCLYLAMVVMACALLGVFLWVCVGSGGVDPIFHGRYPA